MRKFDGRQTFVALGLLALGSVPLVCTMMGEVFYMYLFARMMIFAIAAVSLDLILGYGGMVSFGHAVYLGIGSYAVGILTFYGITDGYIHLAVAIIASALIALFVGALSLRTRGISFIMITLAFTQMIYFLAVSLNEFGGDDGMTIKGHSNFGAYLNLNEPVAFYYFVLFVLLLFLWIGAHLVESRFGIVVRGAKSNEQRMVAIGIHTVRYKLTIFVISGAMCGVAGALLANLTTFVSPAIMHWTRSGEIIMMVVMGGLGTLFGPVVGAVVYLMFEQVLSNFTEHWPVILGPIFVLIVLFAKQGIFGLFRGGSAGRNTARTADTAYG